MRIIVTGDRFWDCRTLAIRTLDLFVHEHGRKNIVIIHGVAGGVDSAFSGACVLARVQHEPYPPDRDQLGKQAGRRRNREMVASGADLCLAVHSYLLSSKGTRDCCLQAMNAGIPAYLISSDDGTPKRLHRDDPRLE
jgi:hypothetical protein